MNLKRSNTDQIIQKTLIDSVINKNIENFNGNLLDVGCGEMPYKQKIIFNKKVTCYTGLDIENALEYNPTVKPDITWDGINMPFESNSFDCAFATEVLEHCPEPSITLNEIHRVLKKDGFFFFTVPFIWNLHEWPHDYYRYTPAALHHLLEKAGFNQIEIKSYGGWHLSLAQFLGLWVQRSQLSKTSRSLLVRIIIPLMKKLIKMDITANNRIEEGAISTGYYGTCKK